MKSYVKCTWMALITGLLCLTALSAGSQEKTPGVLETIKTDQPIVIKSDTLEIDNKRKIVTFKGNVDAREKQLTIKCKEMQLHYRDQPGATVKPEGGKSGIGIEKITAIGSVQITRADGGIARAEKAVYHQEDETVVLTGNPTVKQGDYFVEGSKITLFIKENRSVVEGSRETRVRAVMSPKK